MCGIFGILLRPGARFSHTQTVEALDRLYTLSESRGKESAGLHLYLPESGAAWTMKAAVRATDLLKSDGYRQLTLHDLKRAFSEDQSQVAEPIGILAHSRLVTNGAAELNENNQPVCYDGTTIIHNGIIVNVDELWAAHPDMERRAQVDTEIIAAKLAEAFAKGKDMPQATREAYASIRGAASIAWAHEATNWIVLATNTGDLYLHRNEEQGYIIFASERFILSEALKPLSSAGSEAAAIQWVEPGSALAVSLVHASATPFSLIDGQAVLPTTPRINRPVRHQHQAVTSAAAPVFIPKAVDESLLRYNEERVKSLKRCTACVLPDTFPFISFDEKGVCNYCRGAKLRYKHLDPVASKQRFIASLEKYRRPGTSPDTIVAFSGGRDSSYGLHLIKHEFGLKPVTFTYDWGMVTDLARRNVARICGQLGIQNILVSADIREKRDNIRKNVAAWLNKPDLGMVPLFMAGDKHFFRVVNLLKRQTGIALDLWCANPLENTDFKSGFCGVAPDFDKSRVDYLSAARKIKLAAYYASRFLSNPGYINSSLLDTAGAFFAYYIEPRRDFFFIFDHFPWREEEVNRVLISEYDWELAPDTDSTWRIGDGTAPFYNYIYMTARGFSEFDTFRSNQIREGMLTREQALQSIVVENRPRAQSIRWYLETIGLDFNDTIRRINTLDTMGLHR